MKKYFLWVLFFQCIIAAQSIPVIFMGIIPGGAPAFEKGFDKLLYEHLVVDSRITIADPTDIDILKIKTNFAESPNISRSFIKSLQNISDDDMTLVVWAKISDYSIKPVRKWLILAEAVGSMKVTLTMYSLIFKEHIYLGDINCKTSILKSPVFFSRVDKVTHITASDRTTIIENLKQETAEKSASLIHGVVRGQLIKTGVLEIERLKVVKDTSLSELFDIPTVEAPSVEKEEKTTETESEADVDQKSVDKEKKTIETESKIKEEKDTTEEKIKESTETEIEADENQKVKDIQSGENGSK